LNVVPRLLVAEPETKPVSTVFPSALLTHFFFENDAISDLDAQAAVGR